MHQVDRTIRVANNASTDHLLTFVTRYTLPLAVVGLSPDFVL